ncbi:protein ADM2a [Clupea harengus]|uniref:protein ADM2a n=1 Tax=Clupea harengus TaxID=7950 RepID=A0A6P8EV05_CLUHA|nr:protein ADM2a [Clupea harengus]XP_031414717.1 protein ADM2a [Clupea harengus]
MRCLLPVAVYCISLFCFQQLLALPVGNHLQWSSLDLLLGRPLQPVEGSKPLPQDAPTSPPSGTADAEPSLDLSRTFFWRAILVRGAPLTQTATTTVTNTPLLSDGEDAVPKRRGRRYANTHSRGHHTHHGQPQLMRVGCVLGTCQVQNLSHRLYQLIGQNGRDDSSPINPRSPHSYG